MSSAIKIENLSFSYNGKAVINGLNLEIPQDSVTAILGPNGSGKTTLLKIILGLLQPVSGHITVLGHDINKLLPAERAKLMAYVPQKHQPLFGYEVVDVVNMGRHSYRSLFSMANKDDYKKSEQALEKLGIIHLKNRPYTALSGGEQQLVLIARALVQEAKIVVFDEPVTGLDYANQIVILKQLKLLRESGITCIKTTHNPEHALWTSDFSIFLKSGEVFAKGKTDEIITSKSLSLLYNASMKVIETGKEKGTQIKTCVPDIFS